MGFLDLMKRLGSGFGEMTQDYSTFRQDSADWKRLGPYYKQLRDDEAKKSQLGVENLQARTDINSANAELYQDRAKDTKRLREVEDSYNEDMGRMNYIADADSDEMTKEDFIRFNIRSQLEQDQESDRLQQKSTNKRNEVSIEESGRKLEFGAEDDEAAREARGVARESSALSVEQAKRNAGRDLQYGDANAALYNDALNYAKDKRDAPEEISPLKGDDPPTRKSFKGANAEGFNKSVGFLEKQEYAATDDLLADITEDTQMTLRAAIQMTAGGTRGLLGPGGQPLTEEDIKAVLQMSAQRGLSMEQAMENMGFKEDPDKRNSPMSLLQELRAKPQKFMEQRQMSIARGAMDNFITRYPEVLDKAAAGEMLMDHEVQAIELAITTMRELIGGDSTKYPKELLDALMGIQGRRSMQPNGAVQ